MQNYVKGVPEGLRGLLLKFWDRSTSPQWLELATSNLASGFTSGGTNAKNAKLGQRGF